MERPEGPLRQIKIPFAHMLLFLLLIKSFFHNLVSSACETLSAKPAGAGWVLLPAEVELVCAGAYTLAVPCGLLSVLGTLQILLFSFPLPFSCWCAVTELHSIFTARHCNGDSPHTVAYMNSGSQQCQMVLCPPCPCMVRETACPGSWLPTSSCGSTG